jgi:monoamine oxidase
MDQSWVNEEWTNGCYTSIMGPHTITSLGQHLRTSFGNIHFAGTETAEEWNGYMEGAVRSGEREAKNILAL